jgi:hypothetical protein
MPTTSVRSPEQHSEARNMPSGNVFGRQERANS